jgi:hypothetical protein
MISPGFVSKKSDFASTKNGDLFNFMNAEIKQSTHKINSTRTSGGLLKKELKKLVCSRKKWSEAEWETRTLVL